MQKGKSKSKSSKEDARYVPYARGFKPPLDKIKEKAIGCTSMVPELDPKSHNGMVFFPDLPRPTNIDDWLAQYVEEGQSYGKFLKECPWLSKREGKFMKQNFIPNGKNICEKYPDGKIYLLPLGEFDGKHCVKFESLIEYAEKYLGIPDRQLPGVKLIMEGQQIFWEEDPKLKPDSCLRTSKRSKKTELSTRYDAKTKHIQLRVDESLLKLRNLIPNDAICMIALTMFDLYGDETDLFVAGMAAGNHRVAIFSFYRYDPALTFSIGDWYDITEDSSMNTDDRKKLVMQRSCKLLVHEIGHLLGIDHCIYYDCCMNGSGHLTEDFRQPMHLCPVDLHKLQTLVGFDIVTRYQGLADFYKKNDMKDEFDWVTQRLTCISDAKTSQS